MNIKLDSETLSSMSVFSNTTGVMPKDCMQLDDKFLFVVNQGQAGMSIGKNGVNVKMLEKMFSKEVLIVEYADDPVRLLENIIRPVKVLSGYVTETTNSKKIQASIDGKLALSRLRIAKTLMQRYFNITDINIK